MESRNHEWPAADFRQSCDVVAIGLCVGLCVLMPIGPAGAADSRPLDMPTLHPSAEARVKLLRSHAPVPDVPVCGTICGMPDRHQLSLADPEIQMGGTSAFDLINERRELRFKWRGSKAGFREQSLKLRISRNRSALTWEGRF